MYLVNIYISQNIYAFCFVGWNVFVRWTCGLILFRTSISLLIFCLVILSFAEIGVLMQPTLIADLSVSPFLKTVFIYFLRLCCLVNAHLESFSFIFVFLIQCPHII